MRKNIKPVSIVLTLLITAFLFVLVFPTFKTQAADLTNVFLYLSRIKVNLAGTAGNTVEMVLVFTPTGSFASGGTVEISFPPGAASADVGKWCRTAGALTVAGVTSSPADTGTYTALPGAPTLTAACAQGTGGAGDIITISAVGALTAATKYGVKLTNSTGILGTSASTGSKTVVVQVEQGSSLEAKAFGVYIITEDTVEVEATVSAAPTVECTLNTAKVTMPVLYPGGIISQTTVTNQITTTSPTTGYYWAAYGKGNGTAAGLYYAAGPDLIASSATTVDISGANSEGFGINIGNTTGTVPANFQTGTAGRYGGIVFGPAGAKLILYKTAAATAETADVTYGARADSAATAGTYTEFITYVCGGYY